MAEGRRRTACWPRRAPWGSDQRRELGTGHPQGNLGEPRIERFEETLGLGDGLEVRTADLAGVALTGNEFVDAAADLDLDRKSVV